MSFGLVLVVFTFPKPPHCFKHKYHLYIIVSTNKNQNKKNKDLLIIGPIAAFHIAYFASDNLNVVVGINKKESKEKKNLLEAQSMSFTDVPKFPDSCHRAGKTWISKELPLPHTVKAMHQQNQEFPIVSHSHITQNYSLL